MPIIIHKGEWLTHPDGTRYAKAITDIEANSKVMGKDFELVDGSTPEAHSKIPDDVIVSDGWDLISKVNVNGVWRDLRSKLDVVNQQQVK